MNLVFIVGTAGSGKSELTGSLARWLELQGEDVLAVNLDPGAVTLSYPAGVDVRDYIKLEAVMEEYSLGPNGGLVMACDMLVDIVDRLSRDILEFGPDLVLVDTPGQMELFAFRNTGARLAEGLTDEPKGILYLFDAVFCRDPLNYVMNMFLASAVNARFLLPQISALSKVDLLGEEELEEVSRWGEDPELLEEALDQRLTGLDRLLSRDTMEVIERLGQEFTPIPVSSRSLRGFDLLYSELSKVLAGGERFTR